MPRGNFRYEPARPAKAVSQSQRFGFTRPGWRGIAQHATRGSCAAASSGSIADPGERATGAVAVLSRFADRTP